MVDKTHSTTLRVPYELDKYAVINSLVARLLLARTLYRHMRSAFFWLQVFGGVIVLWVIYGWSLSENISSISIIMRLVVTIPTMIAMLNLRRGIRFLEAIYDEDYLTGDLEDAKRNINVHWEYLEKTWLEKGFGR